jgi:hypothetical protein
MEELQGMVEELKAKTQELEERIMEAKRKIKLMATCKEIAAGEGNGPGRKKKYSGSGNRGVPLAIQTESC